VHGDLQRQPALQRNLLRQQRYVRRTGDGDRLWPRRRDLHELHGGRRGGGVRPGRQRRFVRV
jgi:hypothetical protein